MKIEVKEAGYEELKLMYLALTSSRTGLLWKP